MRRPRAARRAYAQRHSPGGFRPAPEVMAQPELRKRPVARLAYMDGFVAELAEAERRAYRPLTVSTPLRTPTGRHSRRGGKPEYSSYTL